MKPKEWLHKNGHIETIGRGRLSAAHIALINEAVANGENIEGYSVVRGNENKETTAAPVVERTKVDPNRIADIPDVMRDEKSLRAYVVIDGKEVPRGMRDVDYNCGSSFTYCGCESPRTWVDSDTLAVVKFAPRTK